MLTVNLAAQAAGHNLHHFLKAVAFLLGTEYSGNNHKEIFQGDGIEIGAQVYGDTGADRAFAGHAMEAFLVDTP